MVFCFRSVCARMSRRQSSAWLAAGSLAVCLMIAGCRSTSAIELTVSVAASLTGTIEQAEALYTASHPTVHFRNNYGSSGALSQQIQQGAPADLFLSAGAKPVNQLDAKGLLAAGQTHTLLRNALVLIVPANVEAMSVNVQDVLTNPSMRHVALGEPSSVPAGLYAQQSLQALHLDASLQPRMVFGKDVRQVLAYVENGDAQAGFVYATDVRSSNKVRVAAVLDETLHEPIVYPLAVVARTQHLAEAEDFAAFLASPQAQSVFQNKGFLTAEK